MRRRRQHESGYALLFIFMMAAAISVMLYKEAPRLIFEGQRQKEALTVERGEQYIRGIQLFVRKNQARYPQTLEELESYNQLRFLRKRYIDPLTGKDEWRLIHRDAAGILTDSLTQAPPNPAGAAGLNASNNQQPPPINEALLARASDRPASVSGQEPPPPPPLGEEDVQATGQPLPGQSDPNTQTAGVGAPPFPGQQGIPINPNQPPVLPPGALRGGLPPGSLASVNIPGGVGPVLPFTPGQNVPQTGLNEQAGTRVTQASTRATPVGNSAADMINRILTTPRPGGMPTQNTNQGGASAGIAGIASQAEGEGILVYNERTAYKEWEFIYNQSQDPTYAASRGGQNGQPNNGPNNGPSQRPGQQTPPNPNNRTTGPSNRTTTGPGFPPSNFPTGGGNRR